MENGSNQAMYCCEVCGEDGFSEEGLHSHVMAVHLDGAMSCPFCELGDITPEEMLLHVNSAHLDYLTPAREDFVAFIDEEVEEESRSGSGSGGSGLCNGPTEDSNKSSESTMCSPSTSCSGGSGRNLNERNGISGNNEATSSSDGDGLGAASCGSPLRTQLSLNLRRSNAAAAAAAASAAAPLSMPVVQASPQQCCSSSVSRIYRSEAAGGSATPKSCPLCPYTNENAFQLQEHINRQHFDLTSPSFPIISPVEMSEQDVFRCPLCVHSFETASDVELHVNLDHKDILSPAKAAQATPGDENSNESCPVCSMSGFKNSQEMASHIEEHFNQKVSPLTPDVSSDRLLAREMEQREREVRRLREQKEFELLQAQYGMDEQGNFCEQSLTNMQRAVHAGEMTVADYYERQIELRVAERCGVDDGSSCTKGLVPKVQAVSSSTNNVIGTWLCTTVDHYASTYGDKGWGCGYRNIQMMFSALIHNTTYYEQLASAVDTPTPLQRSMRSQLPTTASPNLNRAAVPSISRLQQLIESAWFQGFDPPGCEQLGGKLSNTRKWIGATEVVTLLSSFRVRCQLIDFHKPTAPDGTHPQLFNWVLQYFQKNEDFKLPLYLQHQGHSRTVVGAEQWRDGSIHLLVLDPSHAPPQMSQLKNTLTAPSAMRLIRKSLTVMQARQYQIVAVVGLMETEQEYQRSKMLRQMRIPGDN